VLWAMTRFSVHKKPGFDSPHKVESVEFEILVSLSV